MRLYGLIGYPLSHSFSAKYFAGKFAAEGITDCEYRLFPMDNMDKLLPLIHENEQLCGLNVTIPYKEAVIRFLDELDENIHYIGAVNTIKISRRNNQLVLKGYNTDSYGFSGALAPYVKGVTGGKALILGTGGASKAVAYVLGKLGFSITWVSRKPKQAGQLSYQEVTPAVVAEHRLIVNTSPAGMYPAVDTMPDIPYPVLTDDHILYDLVYNPGETRFMAMGKQQGATVIGGLQMLHLQADKAWEIWNSERL